ncbi:hypothetical protein CMUS01_15323 [Colletotrichum musicola]|uniref:Uncharacterized protein n=1 Tax=Colletotrichum musicola TaxID=2175873 RepID=A0A8H6MMY9_9PEZI|nr:hypothetical protein CMUS01_15323 [Colletotrichum musicola]
MTQFSSTTSWGNHSHYTQLDSISFTSLGSKKLPTVHRLPSGIVGGVKEPKYTPGCLWSLKPPNTHALKQPGAPTTPKPVRWNQWRILALRRPEQKAPVFYDDMPAQGVRDITYTYELIHAP